MNDLKKLAAMTALNNMLRGGHFNICVIDNVAELFGLTRGGEAYHTLHTLHCIDYAEMPQELRDAIPGLIEQVLGVQPAYQFKALGRVLDVNPAPAKSGGFFQLLGIKS